MKKIEILLWCVLCITVSTLVNAQDTKTQFSVEFKIRNLGINVDGFFKSATITSNFISNDISQWTLSGSVKANSISTGIKKRDAHLLEEDYFDVQNYPEIYLKANHFKKTSERIYDVNISLTIKKTTKTFTIPIEIIRDENKVTLKSNFEINRRDFDVGGGSLVLSNNVRVYVNYTLNKN